MPALKRAWQLLSAIVIALVCIALAALYENRQKNSRAAPTPRPPLSVPSAVPQASFKLAASRIGGSVTRVGLHSIELLAHRAGLVEADVSDADGHPLGEPAKLSVELSTSSGAREGVELRYDPRRRSFQGHARSGSELTPGAVDFTFEFNGVRETAQLARAPIVWGPVRGGHVLLVGDISAELFPRANGELVAYLRDQAGNEIEQGDLVLKARMRSVSGPPASIELTRSATCACYAGSTCACYAGSTSATLRPGLVELSLANSTSVPARLLEASLAPEPAHAGRLILTGFYSVELLIRAERLQAYVFDALGKPYPKANFQIALAFGEEDRFAVVPLRFDPKAECYAARAVRGLEKKPVRVSLAVGERAYLGGPLEPTAADARSLRAPR